MDWLHKRSFDIGTEGLITNPYSGARLSDIGKASAVEQGHGG